MELTIEQISQQALSMPQDARAVLADRLAESLEPSEEGVLHRLWAAEALRRRDEVRNGSVSPIPGDVALAQVRHAFGV